MQAGRVCGRVGQRSVRAVQQLPACEQGDNAVLWLPAQRITPRLAALPAAQRVPAPARRLVHCSATHQRKPVRPACHSSAPSPHTAPATLPCKRRRPSWPLLRLAAPYAPARHRLHVQCWHAPAHVSVRSHNLSQLFSPLPLLSHELRPTPPPRGHALAVALCAHALCCKPLPQWAAARPEALACGLERPKHRRGRDAGHAGCRGAECVCNKSGRATKAYLRSGQQGALEQRQNPPASSAERSPCSKPYARTGAWALAHPGPPTI